MAQHRRRAQVIDLKRRHPDVLLVVEVGYKMRFFGDDAETAAKVRFLLSMHTAVSENRLQSPAHGSSKTDRCDKKRNRHLSTDALP